MYALVRCAAPAKALQYLAFAALMKDAEAGQVYEIPLIKVAEKGEQDGRSFLLRLSLPKVSPGTYIVELEVSAQGNTSRVARKAEIS